MKNLEFGELLNKLVEAREKETQKATENLVGGVLNFNKNEDAAYLGPIQTVFSLNLKESLLEFQKHYEEMNKERKDL